MSAQKPRWHSSNALFALLAFVVPPLAIPLLLRRPEGRGTKILGTLVLLGLTGLYVHTGMRVELASGPSTSRADWAELERHREEQARRLGARRRAARAGEPAPVAAQHVEREWTSFRGPDAAGVYDRGPVAREWPAGGLPLLWRQPIGEGWSSFAVADGVAYTLERRRDRELLAAYEVATGLELWTVSWPSRFAESADRDGPRATPLWDEGRVYGLGAAGDLVAVDARSGEELWRRDVLAETDASNITWGVAASPIVVRDLLVVVPGGPDGRTVLALDKRTGETRWSALSDRAAYTTPMLVELAGREQLLVVTATRAVGLDPRDGTLLWEHPWATDLGVNAAQPLLTRPDRFMLSAGYGHGAELVEIVRDGEALAAKTVWTTHRMKNKISSSVFHEGYVYGLDEGILACLDAETGELRWKGGRYGHGQLLLAGAALLVLTEDGELALADASPEAFVERERFSALSGRTWNHPAISSGVLLVRNGREMAAYRIAPSAEAS